MDRVTAIVLIDIFLAVVVFLFIGLLLWPDLQKWYSQHNDED